VHLFNLITYKLTDLLIT